MLTAMLALSATPLWLGVNFTPIVQCELAEAVAVQVPPLTVKSPAFVPLTLSFKGNENGDKLVAVRYLVAEGAVSVPYAIEVGVTVAGIVCAVVIATE